MANFLSSLVGWFGLGRNALSEQPGKQSAAPATVLLNDVSNIKTDSALQLSVVWACVDRRATTIASLPFFVYESLANGQKDLARLSRLYMLLHESPNFRMTPFEFWRAMILNHDLRGNAYARIDRDPNTGEAISLWPMPADQVEVVVLPDGSMTYAYRFDNNVSVYAEQNVLHLKGLGNGTVGFPKLEFMRVTTDECYKAQESASKLFGSGGKPTGVLMIDQVLKQDQRDAVRKNFADMSMGSNTGRLYVLEADMKYQQLSISPEDMQLLDSRKFSIEEVCRWFDVPPVLVHHSNVTAWGSGIEQIIDGFHKFTIRPMLVSIEQSVKKRVMTSRQRATMSVEFNFDALLRGDATARFEMYAKAVQNGLKTRNECRQLENDPPIAGGNDLTAQSNLVPLALLGKTTTQGAANASAQNVTAQ